jgi:hypothetical protein
MSSEDVGDTESENDDDNQQFKETQIHADSIDETQGMVSLILQQYSL